MVLHGMHQQSLPQREIAIRKSCLAKSNFKKERSRRVGARNRMQSFQTKLYALQEAVQQKREEETDSNFAELDNSSSVKT